MHIDRLNNLRPQQAVQAAFAQLSSTQHLTPAEQLAGAALLLREMAVNSGIPVSELLNKAERIAVDADTFFHRELKALRDYVKGEL